MMSKYGCVIASMAALSLSLFAATPAVAAPNYALSLDGSSSYVDTGAAVIPTNGDFTVEVWVNLNRAGNYNHVLSQGSAGNAFYLGVDASSLRVGESWQTTGVAFPTGGWHHLAVVKSSTNTLVFLDGTNWISKGVAITNPAVNAAASGLRLGRQYGGYGEYWPGALDDVRIWNRALSAVEIQTNRLQRPTGTEPGLLAAWEFDAGSGTNCVSFGSVALTNPILGSANWVASGVPWPAVDNALFFNDSSAYLDAGGGIIPATGDYTVACWAFCPRNVGGYREIISQGSPGNAFYLGLSTASTVRMGDGWGDTGVSFPFDSWHHFTLVKTATNAIFYLDGTNRLSKGSTIPNPGSSSPFRLGRQYGSYGEYWPGAMDDVRVWNRALSAAEVQWGYNHKQAGNEAGLVATWEFNEGMGTNVAATVGTNLVLTITNGATWMASPVPWRPIFTSQPTNVVAAVGGAAQLAATAQSDLPLSYQWYWQNRRAIPGATNTTLSWDQLSLSQAGVYYLAASNGNGITISREVFVSPSMPLSWQWQGTNQSNPQTNLIHASYTAGGTYNSPMVAVSAGANHGLGLKADRRVAGWGDNSNQQPAVPDWTTNVAAIASGYYHALVIKTDGTVAGFDIGGNIYSLASATNAVAIAAGVDHSLALKADGTVVASIVAWGTNQYGQASVPATLADVVAIAAAPYHNLALKADGTVVGWGRNSEGQTSIPATATNVVAIAAGGVHSLALKADGTILAWGNNTYSQTNVPATATNIVAIAAGGSHSLALRADGTVVAWGSNNYGQTTVPAAATNIVAIAACAANSLALKADGTAIAWGYYLGSSIFSPDIPASVPAVQVFQPTSGAVNPNVAGVYTLTYSGASDTGVAFSTNRTVVILGPPDVATYLATKVGGTKAMLRGLVNPNGLSTAAWFQWGADTNYGQLTPAQSFANTNTNISLAMSNALTGLVPGRSYHFRLVATNSAGASVGADASFRTPFAGAATVLLNGSNPQTNEWHTVFADPGAAASASPVAIAGGGYHSLAVKADGTVTGWGKNTSGQATAPDYAANVIAIAAGYSHSLALKANGTVVGWGNNSDSQTSIPTSATNVVAIAAGNWHSLAVKADGSVVAWGWYSYDLTTVPAAATNVIAAAGGYGHSLVLKADGTVVAWGVTTAPYNYGQTDVPATATNVVAIAAGALHNLALKADGTIIGWGRNSEGQASVPATATNVVAIAAGGSHSLALKADGTVVAWGFDSAGQTEVPATATNVIAIAGGGYHSLALKADGTIIAWGGNNYGETEVPANVYSLNLPVGVSGLVDTNTPGTYQLTYSYTNAFGQVVTTNRTVVVVRTVFAPPILANLAVIGGSVGFTLSGDSGQTVVVETCTNLAAPVWVPVQTNQLDGSPVNFSAPVQPQHPSQFYRLRTP